jgi:Uma2 family endonuclease
MSTTTKLTFEQYEQLPEQEGTIYELDEGELLMEPSPALRHNLIRQRITMELMRFVEEQNLGIVVEEIDFRLNRDTVRNPDVAFIAAPHLEHVDFDHSPIDGAPALAVEVVSPSNRAEDMARKTHQYLDAGCRSVWIFYSTLRLVEVHKAGSVLHVREPEALKDEDLFPGWSLSLSYAFDGKR